MDEIRDVLNEDAQYPVSVANHEVYVEAAVVDWHRVQPATGHSITVIYGDEVELKILGDRYRSFKPGRMMDVYVRI